MTRKHILQNEASVTVKELTVLEIKQWGKQIVDVRSLRCRYETQYGLAALKGERKGRLEYQCQPLLESLYKYNARKIKETIKEQ